MNFDLRVPAVRWWIRWREREGGKTQVPGGIWEGPCETGRPWGDSFRRETSSWGLDMFTWQCPEVAVLCGRVHMPEVPGSRRMCSGRVGVLTQTASRPRDRTEQQKARSGWGSSVRCEPAQGPSGSPRRALQTPGQLVLSGGAPGSEQHSLTHTHSVPGAPRIVTAPDVPRHRPVSPGARSPQGSPPVQRQPRRQA